MHADVDVDAEKMMQWYHIISYQIISDSRHVT